MKIKQTGFVTQQEALHDWSQELIERISKHNAGLTPQQVEDTLRKGHTVYTSFSYWQGVSD